MEKRGDINGAYTPPAGIPGVPDRAEEVEARGRRDGRRPRRAGACDGAGGEGATTPPGPAKVG